MIYEFLLSWTTGRRGRVVGGKLPRPSWSDVEQHLEAAASAERGTVGLDIVNAAEVGPQSLQVCCALGEFSVTLGELIPDDYRVRELNPAYVKSGGSTIASDFFPTGAVCEDFSLVKRIVREFFETGNVSRDLLS
jgi:hypothetical protein